MKSRILLTIMTFALLLLTGHRYASRALAVNCNSIPVSGNYTVSAACTFPNTPYDGIDAGAGSANTAVLTIGTGGSLTILAGQTLLVGSVQSNSGGSITIIDTGSFRAPGPIYITDADGDLYAASGSQTTTGSVRRNSMTDVYTVDCYDGNANAKPGQTSYFTVNRGDGSYDYDCDSGTETKQYPTADYTCTGCTNGSGYASFINTTNGYQTSVPACGVAGTYYTVSNSTCRDPAVADCSTSITSASVTQGCR